MHCIGCLCLCSASTGNIFTTGVRLDRSMARRLTFSNSLLREEHLADRRCNGLCALLEESRCVQNGVIVHSDLLLDYLRKTYPGLYLVSSTTKVLTEFEQFHREVQREEFRYIVPDFRLNQALEQWRGFPQNEKDKVEFLLYYMTKPEYQLTVREEIYLDNMLDLF